MFTGLMLSLVLCQSKPEVPTVKLYNLNENRTKSFDKDAFSGGSTLTLSSRLQGAAVKDAYKIGNLKLAESTDDRKNDLVMRVKPGEFGPSSDQPEYRVIGQYERDKDKDNLTFWATLRAPERTAKKISAKGTIDLLSGTVSTAEFAGAKGLEGSDLKSEDLDALKLKVTVHKPGKEFFGDLKKQLILKVEGDERPIIENETGLVDGKGKKIETSAYWNFRQPNDKEKARTLTISSNLPIPADAKLVIKFLKDPKVVTVPFEFKDVELP